MDLLLWRHADAQLRAVTRTERALGQRLPIALLGNLRLWRFAARIGELAGDGAVDTEPAHPQRHLASAGINQHGTRIKWALAQGIGERMRLGETGAGNLQTLVGLGDGGYFERHLGDDAQRA